MDDKASQGTRDTFVAGERLQAVPGNQADLWNVPRFVAAFLNNKGGVGKTSSCHHLAGAFSSAGRKLLLIDADPQANLSKGIFGPEWTESLSDEESLSCLYDDAYDPDPARLIRQTPFEGISLLPSTASLNDHNRPRPENAGL